MNPNKNLLYAHNWWIWIYLKYLGLFSVVFRFFRREQPQSSQHPTVVIITSAGQQNLLISDLRLFLMDLSRLENTSLALCLTVYNTRQPKIVLFTDHCINFRYCLQVWKTFKAGLHREEKTDLQKQNLGCTCTNFQILLIMSDTVIKLPDFELYCHDHYKISYFGIVLFDKTV